MNQVIRIIHRWTSLLFSLIVASIFAGMALTTLPEWYYYLPLPPLFVLIPTGIYMFFAPYFGGRQETARGPSLMAKDAAPKLLSGGNPQIGKGYGDAVVQSYIDAMPDWKQDVGRRIDALVTEAVPGVVKAVKWNSPFYGMEKDIWFLGFHCMTKYVKVAFFKGAQLSPLPPGTSKQADVRYLDIYDSRPFDEAQFSDWVRQASALPGEKM